MPLTTPWSAAAVRKPKDRWHRRVTPRFGITRLVLGESTNRREPFRLSPPRDPPKIAECAEISGVPGTREGKIHDVSILQSLSRMVGDRPEHIRAGPLPIDRAAEGRAKPRDDQPSGRRGHVAGSASAAGRQVPRLGSCAGRVAGSQELLDEPRSTSRLRSAASTSQSPRTGGDGSVVWIVAGLRTCSDGRLHDADAAKRPVQRQSTHWKPVHRQSTHRQPIHWQQCYADVFAWNWPANGDGRIRRSGICGSGRLLARAVRSSEQRFGRPSPAAGDAGLGADAIWPCRSAASSGGLGRADGLRANAGNSNARHANRWYASARSSHGRLSFAGNAFGFANSDALVRLFACEFAVTFVHRDV